MVSVQDFLANNGTDIRWQALASAIVGATIGAFFEGVVAVILRWGDATFSLLQGVAQFLAAVVNLRIAAQTGIVLQSWQEAIAFVEDAGLFGIVVATAIVLATLYVAAILRPGPGWLD